MELRTLGALTASRFLFETIIYDSDSDSDDDFEEKQNPSRVENFLERTVPGFTAKEFQSHFRISRDSFTLLARYLAHLVFKS